MADKLSQELLRMMREQDDADEARAFNEWCNDLLSQPSDLQVQPIGNFQVDIELQPLRWLWLGIELVESNKIRGGLSYLRYAVFQMGTEIFLKGMWLCQFDECRTLTSSSYIDQAARRKYFEELGPNGLGHDLIEIINELRKIREYAEDAAVLQFLDLIERIIRRYYWPPYRADKRARWAHARYPKRLYSDVARKAEAESFQSYPSGKWVAKLFRNMQRDADRVWRLQAGLAEQRKRSRLSAPAAASSA
jgi:hypothetical protein